MKNHLILNLNFLIGLTPALVGIPLLNNGQFAKGFTKIFL